MSNTPRTDACISKHPSTASLHTMVESYNDLLAFARQLERELTATRQAAIADVLRWVDKQFVFGADELKAEITRLSTLPTSHTVVPVETIDEAKAALYGCREVLGNVANIQHAIDLLTAARKP